MQLSKKFNTVIMAGLVAAAGLAGPNCKQAKATHQVSTGANHQVNQADPGVDVIPDMCIVIDKAGRPVGEHDLYNFGEALNGVTSYSDTGITDMIDLKDLPENKQARAVEMFERLPLSERFPGMGKCKMPLKTFLSVKGLSI